MVLFFGYGMYHGLLVRPQVSFVIATGLGVLLFGIMSVHLLRRKLLRPVLIRLDSEGLHRPSGRVIRWKDVRAIRQTSFKFNRFLEVDVDSGTQGASQEFSSPARANKGQHAWILISCMDVTADDIFRIVERRSRPYRDE
ncbi:MAG: hypothetical protein ACO1TE_11435 [Prosthecobacter sp.]